MGSCRPRLDVIDVITACGGGEKDRQRSAAAWSQAGRARDSHDGCAGPEGIVPVGSQTEIIRR
jgi:hypothetical protein